jgi:hypothetical protein
MPMIYRTTCFLGLSEGPFNRRIGRLDPLRKRASKRLRLNMNMRKKRLIRRRSTRTLPTLSMLSWSIQGDHRAVITTPTYLTVTIGIDLTTPQLKKLAVMKSGSMARTLHQLSERMRICCFIGM